MTILMAYALVADTWDTCIIATAREVVLTKSIPSQRLRQICPSTGGPTYF